MPKYEFYVYFKDEDHPELEIVEAETIEEAQDKIISLYEEENPDRSILEMRVKSIDGENSMNITNVVQELFDNGFLIQSGEYVGYPCITVLTGNKFHTIYICFIEGVVLVKHTYSVKIDYILTDNLSKFYENEYTILTDHKLTSGTTDAYQDAIDGALRSLELDALVEN